MKILRMPDVRAMTGLSSASIYKQIRLGRFPKGIKLTADARDALVATLKLGLKTNRHQTLALRHANGVD